MTCKGCQKRREWLHKQATKVFGKTKYKVYRWVPAMQIWAPIALFDSQSQLDSFRKSNPNEEFKVEKVRV